MRTTQNVCLTLPPEVLEELDRRAAEQERSRSNMVRRALQEWLLSTAAPAMKGRQAEVRP
jgi:metal-responsive CopG/Arc/MetJ family transcriptional regulator